MVSQQPERAATKVRRPETAQATLSGGRAGLAVIGIRAAKLENGLLRQDRFQQPDKAPRPWRCNQRDRMRSGALQA